MRIRLSTLAENSASWLGLLGEWGLSILVETDDISILVDTGRSGVAAHNARIMRADIKKIDKIIFSHGHEDHTGGLVDLLKLRDLPETPVEVIAHPDVWAPKYWHASNGDRYSYVGIPYARKLAESLGASFHLTPEPVWITDRIVTSGEVPMVTDYEAIDASACILTDDGYGPDPLKDDQSLFIKTEKGLVIVSGCAHRGIVNTINHAQKLTGCDDIYAIVGGIHLFGASDHRIRMTLEEIKRLNVQRIGVSHCTGAAESAFLAHALGDRFFFNQAGTCTELDL
jgi:7,8-dihydropterin-6-yl-methyl-4-(beta-D-ribofuranosyl)aminobenzene 5'-phosphate synthase